jgi:nitrite reductase (cytochrome c-552)
MDAQAGIQQRAFRQAYKPGCSHRVDFKNNKEGEMSVGAKNILAVCLCMAVVLVLVGCEPPKPQSVQTVTIPDGEINPAVWGKAYPVEYELWKKTAEPVGTRRSKYKTGMDSGAVTVDKLSQFPYMALLFNGWGFGVEYNEPRGHAYMIRDQLEIDASRLKAGGVCLRCKSPYGPLLLIQLGEDYY